MRVGVLVVMAIVVTLLQPAAPAAAQSVGRVFDKVNPSVVVIWARGHDASDAGTGLVTFNETGSGSGKTMDLTGRVP